jgi:hypothetical protein
VRPRNLRRVASQSCALRFRPAASKSFLSFRQYTKWCETARCSLRTGKLRVSLPGGGGGGVVKKLTEKRVGTVGFLVFPRVLK